MGLGGKKHGKQLAFKLDDAAGALQDLTAKGIRKVSGLPGKTDRPPTDAAGDDDELYEVVGKSDGGPVSITGIWQAVIGTKLHGRQMVILTDQYDLTSRTRTFSVSRSIDLPESDAAGDDWKRKEIIGKRKGTLSFGGLYDSAAGKTSPLLWAYLRASTPGVVSAAPGGFAIGNLVEMLAPYQGSFNIDEDHNTGPVPVSADFVPSGRIDLGVSLHDLVAEAAAGPTNYTAVDESASTTAGGVAHIHVTLFSGLTNAIVKLQDSADNVTFADLAGATFATITAVTKERIVLASNATVRRYVRAVCTTTGGPGSVTFAVAFARRGSTYGAAGTYRHWYELLGHANTQSFEYGPEGSAAGAEKFSGEARLSKLDVSLDHANGPVEYTAELTVDGSIANGVFS